MTMKCYGNHYDFPSDVYFKKYGWQWVILTKKNAKKLSVWSHYFPKCNFFCILSNFSTYKIPLYFWTKPKHLHCHVEFFLYRVYIGIFWLVRDVWPGNGRESPKMCTCRTNYSFTYWSKSLIMMTNTSNLAA